MAAPTGACAAPFPFVDFIVATPAVTCTAPVDENFAPTPADIQRHLEQLPWLAQLSETVPSTSSDPKQGANSSSKILKESHRTMRERRC